jgi:acyl carrier protein
MKPLNDLKKTFCDALEIGADTDFDTLKYRSVPEWDSVAHMRLIGALENKFDIMLQTDDVLGMSSFQKAREILQTHGVEFAD